MWTEAELARRARRAYERRRLRHALRDAALVGPVAGLAFLHCAGVAPTAVAVSVLLALVAACSWRGQDYARGLHAGLLAGLSPFLLPLLAQLGGHACSRSVCLYLPTACILGGLLGGLTLAALGLRPHADMRAYAGSALAVTLVAGAVGCLFAGLAGLGGMALGVAAGSAPLLIAQKA
jgi:hypothetical protein